MNRYQLRPGLHFWLKGREYVIKQQLANGELQICEVVTEVLSRITYTALVQFLFREELELQSTESFSVVGRKGNENQADFTQLPEEIRFEAKRKYSYVSFVLEQDIPQRTPASLQPIIEQVSEQINDLNPPNWLTLYRWLKAYESSGQDIRSLVPKHKYKGDYRPKLEKEVIQIIDSCIQEIYLNPSRPDMADVHDEILRQIRQENLTRASIGQKALEIPHRSTIYRFASKLDPCVVAKKRLGNRIASQMYDPVMKGPRPNRPLERIEIDHTKLPLFVVDAEHRMPIGTPWLTSAVDKYSGVILGYYASFEPPSYLSVMQCLLHVIRPKNYLIENFPSVVNTWDTYGLPEVIVVDNGKEFYSTHFEDACLSLGIAIQYSPPRMPWYKSSIERYFGAVNSQLLSDLPGKSFSNFMKKYDYNPLKNAVISFEALQEILHIFIIDIYNQSSHPELKSPRTSVWSKAIQEFPPALPGSYQQLKVLVGNITTRKVTRRGVEFEGLIYNSFELSRFRSSALASEKATIKYDPTDLSQIYVFDPTIHQFLSVPALSQEYTKGLSIWQHQVIKKLARQEAEKVDIIALALAKEQIQKIVDQEWMSSKKGKTRTAMARWKGIGRSGLNTGDFEFSKDEQLLNNDMAINSIAPETVTIPKSEFSVMSGISELGSAFNNEFSSSSIEENREKIEVENFNNIQSPSCKDSGENSIKPNKRKSSPNKKVNVEVSDKLSENLEETASWKPDLSGWDVSIGLPS
ncbi:DDE-type integrase/transposase/recombinase [Nostoc sp. WHI]|nr:DDE-type integrase/transposase/recombinase [Nostoc sp. WHI]